MTHRPPILRHGDWREALADVEEVDAVICDPPFSQRTHEGDAALAISTKNVTKQKFRNALNYDHFDPSSVSELVGYWAPRCKGWMVAFTSHDLIQAWEAAYEAAGRYYFAPVLHLRKRPRLLGDGPASWADYMMVSRPRSREWSGWGCLPGWYMEHGDRSPVVGGKSVGVMRAIVRDYSKPGDLICDPFAGGGTTLLAAQIEGRRAIGSEIDPVNFAKAKRRVEAPFTPNMFEV